MATPNSPSSSTTQYSAISANVVVESQTLKQWSVSTYHRMSELGILASDERTELIAGHITVMAAKGTPHVTALRLLATQFDAYLSNLPFFASTQDPIHIDEFSEPEPDLAIVRGSVLDYADHHPTPEEIVLLVEVADSTLKQDTEVKDKLYAGAGIAEYWVQDLKRDRLHIFRQPMPTGYQSHSILSKDATISPLAFADLVLSVGAIFPPS